MPHRDPRNGFWITYTRLALLVILCAGVPTGVYAYLSLQDKVSVSDQLDSFRKGCDRNVGNAQDAARITSAERRYKHAVLDAASVKGDVKEAVVQALLVYDNVYPRQLARVIDCKQAFPAHGKPKVVRLKWSPE